MQLTVCTHLILCTHQSDLHFSCHSLREHSSALTVVHSFLKPFAAENEMKKLYIFFYTFPQQEINGVKLRNVGNIRRKLLEVLSTKRVFQFNQYS
jgi:hypothetical protein